ncbi:hypothetical protein BGZ74_006700, partial [Mortierella antarctica]
SSMCRARCWRAVSLQEMVGAEEVKFWVSVWEEDEEEEEAPRAFQSRLCGSTGARRRLTGSCRKFCASWRCASLWCRF